MNPLNSFKANELIEELHNRGFQFEVTDAPPVEEFEVIIKWLCPYCNTENDTDFEFYNMQGRGDSKLVEVNCDNCSNDSEISFWR